MWISANNLKWNKYSISGLLVDYSRVCMLLNLHLKNVLKLVRGQELQILNKFS